MPPDERVLKRPIERVAHMEDARHVRRRHGDNVRRPRVVGLGVVEALLFPGALPAFLDAVRLVERLQLHQAPILAGVKRMSAARNYSEKVATRLDCNLE